MSEEEILEECPECEGTGAIEGSMAFVSICPKCEGACYIDHFCWEQE